MQYFIEKHRLPLKTTAKIHAKGGVRNSAMKADKYFSELTPEQVTKLYELYKVDFEMFGYEHERYLELSQLDLNKKVKNSFDRALNQVKNEGKLNQVLMKNKHDRRNKNAKKKKQKSNVNSKV